MKVKNQEVNGWQDFIELCIASWLIISPFALGFFEVIQASLTALLIGSVAVMMAVLGMATRRQGDEWANMGAGVFLLASPWLFGYADMVVATVNAIACGALLILFAWLAMMEERQEMQMQHESSRSRS